MSDRELETAMSFGRLARLVFLLWCLGAVSLAHAGGPAPLLDTVLDADASVIDPNVIETARSRWSAVTAGVVDACGPNPASACIVQALFAGGGGDSDPIIPNGDGLTVSESLTKGSSACAVRVALVLAVGQVAGEELRAVEFREHIAIAGDDGLVYETLAGGKAMPLEDATRLHGEPPGGVRTLDSRSFVPLYFDSLANAAITRREFELAEELFLSAMALAPGWQRPRFNYGTFLLERDRCQDALPILEASIQEGWTTTEAWINLGVAEALCGDTTAAVESFRSALRKDPKNRRAKANLVALEEQ